MSDPIEGVGDFKPGQTVYRVEWPDVRTPKVEALVFLFYVTTSYARVRYPHKSDDFMFSEIAENLYPTALEALEEELGQQQRKLERFYDREIPLAEKCIGKLKVLLKKESRP